MNRVVLLLAVASAPLPVLAQKEEDKSGVAPNTISRPQGPGSLEGLGDAFQPALNTGTAKYRVQIALPPGVAGFAPEVVLSYDGGNGYGPLGIGWDMGPGCVRRQSDKGLPRYIDPPGGGGAPDRFVGMEGEELVPLAGGAFLAKIEGTHLRYRRVGDHWEARTKSGVLAEFGLSPAARVADTATGRIYKWCLERQTDPHGNVIEYVYSIPHAADRQCYLDEIRYGPGAPAQWTDNYSVHFYYEDRDDTFTDYRSGFSVRTARRLSGIEVKFNDTLIRRYAFGYAAHPHWSLLTTVQQFGSDNASMLPPTTFGYNTTDLCAGDPPLSAAGDTITSSPGLGPVMDNPYVDLVDINADGLPDVLDTSLLHAAYLNRGAVNNVLRWTAPQDVLSVDGDAEYFDLGNDEVHLADMTGDGVADLVVTDFLDTEYFANNGDLTWASGVHVAPTSFPPPLPFGPDSANVKTGDFDFDKRIDIIATDELGYSLWLNRGDGLYSEPILTDGARYFGDVIDLADPGVHLADMNGDRLLDVVKITSGGVIVCPAMGYGQFDTAVEIPLLDRFIDVGPGGNLARANVQDVNGDGLADLVVERAANDDLWLWLNLGNDSLALSCTITDLPTSADAVVRWADINGNGTTDLVYADSFRPDSRINAVDIGRMLVGATFTNALTSIDNGLGRVVTIDYESSMQFALAASAAGNPWTTALPMPVHVVSRVATGVGLNLDGVQLPGQPAEDVYLTDLVYRDGYYDPIEKQFRGFAFVKQLELGDEDLGAAGGAPTLVTRFCFHTGAPDGEDNDNDGQTDEADFFAGAEEEPLKGVELWRETTTLPDDPLEDGAFAPDAKVFQRAVASWAVRNLCTPTGGLYIPAAMTAAGLDGAAYRTADYPGYARDVRQAVRTRVDTQIIELGVAPAKTLRVDTDLDPFGNEITKDNRGDLANPRDNLYEATEFVLVAAAEASWMVDRPKRVVQRDGGPAGLFVSETRYHYDGDSFTGLPLGQLGARGLLHRTEAVVDDGTAPAHIDRSYTRGDPRTPGATVNVLRQQFDAHGNPVVLRDARGHDRLLAYDDTLHTYPVTETILLGDGPDLVVTATYDYLWGKPLTFTEFNGHISRFEYDEFGRLFAEYLPGDPAAEPTRVYSYDLGAPFSSITTTAHPREGDMLHDVVMTQFFDGMGRKLGLFEEGGPVMREVTCYNRRGKACKVYQPYTGQPLDGMNNWQSPPPATPAVSSAYDATLRPVETTTPPDANAAVAVSRTEYEPLTTIEYDGEDNRAASPHFGTPKTLVYDGLERLIEVHEIETLSAADSGTFITRYRYAMPDLLAEIEDANSNIKYMRYDGLGRKVFMNDLNRGHMTYAYDPAGNLVETIDAKDQHVVYTYDAAGRIASEDFLDEASPLSLHKTPDVAYHYDEPSACHPYLPNTAGRLAWVSDLTGAEYRGYNARGQHEVTVKEIDQLGGGSEMFSTTTLLDNLDRVYQIVYPDGGVVRQRFGARGMLSQIPNFAPSLTYTPAGQKHQVFFANGVVTTHTYDPRLRLTGISTVSPAETMDLQDLSYEWDQADNITHIEDGRPLPPEELERSQTASYLMDNLYRLQQADGEGYGIINYDYDRLGNMASQGSEIPDPDVDLGTMHSGGLLGTSGRIGRGPADPPGPHALTSIIHPVSAQNRAFAYDANGNMTDNNGDEYEFDFADRLATVRVAGSPIPAIRYLYDHSDRRVIKRVDDEQTSYIDRYSEIRGGEMLKYVWNNDERLVQAVGEMPAPPIVTQRISLQPGWNAVSFQVEPGTTDVVQILYPLIDIGVRVFAISGTTFIQYYPLEVPNGVPEVHPSLGLWIQIPEPAEFVLSGNISTISLQMFAGWNFSGLHGLATPGLQDNFLFLPGIVRIWGPYYDQQWSLADPSLDFASTNNVLAPGTAYWLYFPEDTTVEYSIIGPVEARYLHVDFLGTTITCSDQFGHQDGHMAYFPFGNARTLGGGSAQPNPCIQRFAGKEVDSVVELVYFESRHLDPVLARFVSTDSWINSKRWAIQMSITSPWGIRNPQSMNQFAYVINNPIALVDPNGSKVERKGDIKENSATEFIDTTVDTLLGSDADLSGKLGKLRITDGTRDIDDQADYVLDPSRTYSETGRYAQARAHLKEKQLWTDTGVPEGKNAEARSALKAYLEEKDDQPHVAGKAADLSVTGITDSETRKKLKEALEKSGKYKVILELDDGKVQTDDIDKAEVFHVEQID